MSQRETAKQARLLAAMTAALEGGADQILQPQAFINSTFKIPCVDLTKDGASPGLPGLPLIRTEGQLDRTVSIHTHIAV